MARRTSGGTQALTRGFDLLAAISRDLGQSNLGEIARSLDLPASTAHRMAKELTARGLLVRVGRGRYMPGFELMRLGGTAQPNDVLVAAARPILRQLAAATRRVAHLGQLEDGMVTYLVREAPDRSSLFTREAMQLEAYCSAIGKMLLSIQPPETRDSYLAEGEFIALTPRTMVNVGQLRANLAQVAKQGFAVDDEEVEQGLFCMAVELATPTLCRPTAISLAGSKPAPGDRPKILCALKEAATAMSRKIGCSA